MTEKHELSPEDRKRYAESLSPLGASLGGIEFVQWLISIAESLSPEEIDALSGKEDDRKETARKEDTKPEKRRLFQFIRAFFNR